MLCFRTGSLLVYKSSEAMASSVDVIATTFTNNLNDLENFLDNTISVISFIIQKGVSQGSTLNQ